MHGPAQPLYDMKREHDFLICIDSDGCVFDTMEVKHKECFIPNIIKYWNFQAVDKFARETAEYVNLYSKSRGINRFPALLEVFDLVAERPEVIARGYRLPDIASFRQWVATEPKMGNPALESYVAAHPDDALMAHMLAWSKAVNETIADMVHGVPPFPYVRESLAKMAEQADIIVVSQTPNAALEREWAEHGIDRYAKVIAGQEMGTKADCIGYAKTHGYANDHVLMIGDAPGDLKAGKRNDALFFPINPSEEDASWKQLYEESLDRFFGERYAGDYEAELIRVFDGYLPATPPWKR